MKDKIIKIEGRITLTTDEIFKISDELPLNLTEEQITDILWQKYYEKHNELDGLDWWEI